MTCTRCGHRLEWWPLSQHWASLVTDAGNVDVWTFICPARTSNADPYHLAPLPWDTI